MNRVSLAAPIALGVVAGVLLRWAVFEVFSGDLETARTVLVNGVGCLLMGLFVRRGWRDSLDSAATIGLCGGLTTFSTFALDAAIYFDSSRWSAGAFYVAATVVVSSAAYLIGRQVTVTSR